MKSLFTFLLVAISTLSSCTLREKPTFVSIEKINLDKVSSEEITFKASAIFKNPNSIGGEISSETIKIFVDSIPVGQLYPSSFNVPAKNEFSIPLEGRLSTKKIMGRNNNDLLSNLINIVTSQKVAITFKGDLIFKKGLFKHTYHLNETNDIRIKL